MYFNIVIHFEANAIDAVIERSRSATGTSGDRTACIYHQRYCEHDPAVGIHQRQSWHQAVE